MIRKYIDLRVDPNVTRIIHEARWRVAKIDQERRAQRTARFKALKALIAVREAFRHDEQINGRWLSAQVREAN